MNILDALITALAPGVALKREQSRFQAKQLRRVVNAYEAGGTGRRFGGMNDRSTSANMEVLRSLPRLRNRHREMVRNNPWAAAAIRAIVTNTIGYGITGEVFAGKDRDDKLTDLFLGWAETTACDVAGMHNIYGLQALAMQSTSESGEVLLRRRWRRPV
jgi:capsid protein